MIADYIGASNTFDGETIISFEVDDADEIKELVGQEVVVEVKPLKGKRSLNANAYLWKLCSELAKVLGTTKEKVYIRALEDYGVMHYIEVIEDAASEIEGLYRHCVVEDTYTAMKGQDKVTMKALRCYIGSSHYDSREMAYLLDGVVNDCKELDIPVWPQYEIDKLVARWG